MANKIQLKRGVKSRLSTLSAGEPAFTTDTRELFLGTGSGNVNMSGNKWYNGTAMNGTSTSTTYTYSACPLVKLGDMYLNTTTGCVYECTTSGSGTSARWTYQGCIKGNDGTVATDNELNISSSNPVKNKVVRQQFIDQETFMVEMICAFLRKQSGTTYDYMKTLLGENLRNPLSYQSYQDLEIEAISDSDSEGSCVYLSNFVAYITCSTQGVDRVNDNDGHSWETYNAEGTAYEALNCSKCILKFDAPKASGAGKCYILLQW